LARPISFWDEPRFRFQFNSVALAVLVNTLLSVTVLGRYIYTLGDSEQALIVTGVGLPQIKTIVYMLCGTLTAVGGILMTSRLGVAAPTAATGYELDIIAAVIIGGTSLFGGVGSIVGVLLGRFLCKWCKMALFY